MLKFHVQGSKFNAWQLRHEAIFWIMVLAYGLTPGVCSKRKPERAQADGKNN